VPKTLASAFPINFPLSSSLLPSWDTPELGYGSSLDGRHQNKA
jgi:hypothetical protein